MVLSFNCLRKKIQKGYVYTNLFILNKIVYISVLSILIFFDLNMNFLYKSLKPFLKQNINYRIREHFKFYEFEQVSNLNDLLLKSFKKSDQIQNATFLFSIDRFNIHFLSNSSLKNIENLLKDIDPYAKSIEVNLKNQYINQIFQIKNYKAKYELILRTQSNKFLRNKIEFFNYGNK